MTGYKCGICKKSVKFDVKNIGMQCPYCGSKIFYKERPTVAKRIKSKQDFMKSASFIFNFDTNDEARVVAESLNPEIKQKIPKTKIKTNISGKTFSIEIQATDISTLRAACNSYLRWINTALNVKKTV